MSELGLLVQEIETCVLCDLSSQRTRTVPGEGSSYADLMFIGEGPGFFEDREGRPFVGAAGRFLRMYLGMVQPGQSRLHDLAVVEKDRNGAVRVILIGRRGHPVMAVFRKQVHPVFEPALVQKTRFSIKEFFDIGLHVNEIPIQLSPHM